MTEDLGATPRFRSKKHAMTALRESVAAMEKYGFFDETVILHADNCGRGTLDAFVAANWITPVETVRGRRRFIVTEIGLAASKQ